MADLNSKISKMLDDFTDTFNASDQVGLSKLLTKDSVVLPPGTRTITGNVEYARWAIVDCKPSICSKINKFWLVGDAELLADGIALSTYNASYVDGKGNTREARELGVFKLEGGQWKMYKIMWGPIA